MALISRSGSIFRKEAAPVVVYLDLDRREDSWSDSDSDDWYDAVWSQEDDEKRAKSVKKTGKKEKQNKSVVQV